LAKEAERSAADGEPPLRSDDGTQKTGDYDERRTSALSTYRQTVLMFEVKCQSNTCVHERTSKAKGLRRRARNVERSFGSREEGRRGVQSFWTGHAASAHAGYENGDQSTKRCSRLPALVES